MRGNAPLLVFVLMHTWNLFLASKNSHVTNNVTEFKVGVIIISDSGAPYDVERAGAAIDLAFEKVNTEILNASYRITQIKKRYGPVCDAEKAPGIYVRIRNT